MADEPAGSAGAIEPLPQGENDQAAEARPLSVSDTLRARVREVNAASEANIASKGGCRW
ncbi:hypothetical protein [Streptomyces sp. NPDC127098]|uniref:hypothetical protein n=1 Tax=Streptomyces sp. NPDC127098 TaxID=3347137 RepID=UPI00364D7D96